MPWPETVEALIVAQDALGCATPEPWIVTPAPLALGGCFVCFPRGMRGRGGKGDPGWAAAVVLREGTLVAQAIFEGTAGAAYEPGLLALREGQLLEGAVRAAGAVPDVLLVDATGRDHPRRAGLALHLGAILGVPTVGVTHRPLVATGSWPSGAALEAAPLVLGDEVVGAWLRTRAGTRPLAVHAAWRTDPDKAVAVVIAALGGRRTPEPVRLARTLAREARVRARDRPFESSA